MAYLINIALGLFGLAIFAGLIVLVAILTDRPTLKPAVFIHGGLAILGLCLLIFSIIKHHGTGPILSVSILLLAAIGGFTLFTIDMKKKPIPKWLAVGHPIIAMVGFVLLIGYALF